MDRAVWAADHGEVWGDPLQPRGGRGVYTFNSGINNPFNKIIKVKTGYLDSVTDDSTGTQLFKR